MPNITFLEAGGASTGGTQLWNALQGNAPVVDTSVKPPGAYSSLRFQRTGTSTLDGLRAFAGNFVTAERCSFYFRTSALPATEEFIAGIDTSFGYLVLNSDGKLRIYDGELNPTDGTHALSPNNWYRITISFDLPGISQLSMKVFLDGVEDISQTGMNTSGSNDATGFRLFTFGVNDNEFNYYAHTYVDDGSDLTDTGNKGCTAKFSTSVNNNNWDTVIGTGAVNQRPLSEADGIESLLTTGTDQDYNIQTRNVGDVNLTSLPIVGYMGWAWAKEVSIAGSPALIVNGTSYGITLITSSAIYRQPITSSSYPSNAATIGMTSGTVGTFMYECGIVMAYDLPVQVKLITLAFAGK